MTNDLLSADIQLIQRILPHRYPFLLVDKVVNIDGTGSALGIKNVTMNEPHFQGHFPGMPIMPGVTIVEAMAQTAALMGGTALGMADREMKVYFMSIDNCKFRRKVIPGDVLEMKLTTLRGNLVGTLRAKVVREGVHSGGASGIVPSSFRIIRQLLDRVEDAATGEIRIPALHADIPDSRIQQARAAAEILGDSVWQKFAWDWPWSSSRCTADRRPLSTPWSRSALPMIGKSLVTRK